MLRREFIAGAGAAAGIGVFGIGGMILPEAPPKLVFYDVYMKDVARIVDEMEKNSSRSMRHELYEIVMKTRRAHNAVDALLAKKLRPIFRVIGSPAARSYRAMDFADVVVHSAPLRSSSQRWAVTHREDHLFANGRIFWVEKNRFDHRDRDLLVDIDATRV